jgi:hypothetical protein
MEPGSTERGLDERLKAAEKKALRGEVVRMTVIG